MKRISASLAFAASLSGGMATAQAAPVVYQIDPTHTLVHFEMLHFGTSTIRGRFGPVGGDISIDREAGRGHVGVTIPTAGVSTGVPTLDSRIRQKDLLATDEYPQAYFVSDNFAFGDDKEGKGLALKEVRGELTLRGSVVPVTLTPLRFNCYLNPLLRREVCGGDFEAFVDRSKFGATYGMPFVPDRVRLVIQIEAVRQE